MTEDQAYMIWKCTGRADQKKVPDFRRRRAGELALEKLSRIVKEASNAS